MMADHRTVSFTLSEDRSSVTITFHTDPSITLSWSTDAVADVVRLLGDIRANMLPPVTADLALGQLVNAVPDPRWQTEPDVMLGNSLLHVRDPRFGWLHYLIPRHEARRLAGFLQTQADAPSPTPEPGKTH